MECLSTQMTLLIGLRKDDDDNNVVNMEQLSFYFLFLKVKNVFDLEKSQVLC